MLKGVKGVQGYGRGRKAGSLRRSPRRMENMKTHFQVQSVDLAVSAADELSHQSFDVQCFLLKILALFSSRVTKSLKVGSSSGKRPSADTEKAKRSRKASGSEDTIKPTECPSSCKDSIPADSVKVEKL